MFKRGAPNTNADVLSRIFILQRETEEPAEGRITVTEEKTKATVLHEFHDSPIGRHRDINKTDREIRIWYQWPRIGRDIEAYVKKCESCQRNKSPGLRASAQMVITTTARKPSEKCSMDIVGSTTVTNKGNRYHLTSQDELTKFVSATSIPNQEAETVAREFVINIVLRYGTPTTLLTDQGSHFLSDVFLSAHANCFAYGKFRPRLSTQKRTEGLNGGTGFLSSISDIT